MVSIVNIFWITLWEPIWILRYCSSTEVLACSVYTTAIKKARVRNFIVLKLKSQSKLTSQNPLSESILDQNVQILWWRAPHSTEPATIKSWTIFCRPVFFPLMPGMHLWMYDFLRSIEKSSSAPQYNPAHDIIRVYCPKSQAKHHKQSNLHLLNLK